MNGYFCILLFAQSNEHPLASPLDEFVQHHRHVRQHEAADVEAEEFGGVAGAEFEADVCGRRVLEAWIFDLASDLICIDVLARLGQEGRWGVAGVPSIWTESNSFARLLM